MPDLEANIQPQSSSINDDVSIPSTSHRQCSSAIKEFIFHSMQKFPKRCTNQPTVNSHQNHNPRSSRTSRRQLRSSSMESKVRISNYSNNANIDPTFMPHMEKCTLLEAEGQKPFEDKKRTKKLSRSTSVDTLLSDKQCRICHSGADSRRNPLISPCRCNGTMKHVHLGCLIRWLEISSQKFWPTNECELCGYKFKRHPIWRIRRIRWPSSTYQDKILNYLFLFLLFLMFLCGTIASKYSHDAEHSRFKTSRVVKLGNAFFSGDEIMVVVSGILFFFCFILALCTQYRAGGTIFRQCVRFWTINRNWQIKNYNIEDDQQLLRQRRQQISSVNVDLLAVVTC